MFQGAPPASPANNSRDHYGNLHHTISIVAQKATLTPTIKRETVYTKECHTSTVFAEESHLLSDYIDIIIK